MQSPRCPNTPWKLAAVIAVAAFLLLPAARLAADVQQVTWVNQVNVTTSGTVLQKTSGCDGCADAGASSQEELTAGDGYVEFTVGETNTFWVAGLSHGDSDTSYADVDFAFRFNGAGWVDILENGVYQAGGDSTYAVGDVFRVAVVGGRVHYFRNGQFLRESAVAPQYPLVLDAALGSVGATVRDAVLGVSPPPPPGGGFTEKAGSPALRARFTPEDIQSFLPPGGARGAFTFPAPYHTTGVRLTNATDCAFGQDCLWYLGYSYWRNINNHVASTDMYIFLGMDRNRGGAGPSLIRYDKLTDAVVNTGPLFAPDSPYSHATGEGWYFSATLPTRLYVFLPGSPQLHRYDVAARLFEPVPAVDLARCPRPRVCPAEAVSITQPHSSDDDLMHSATVQNADWQGIGCLLQADGARWSRFFPAPADAALDECHIDKSGRWLILLEVRPDGSRQNRVVHVRSGRTTTITDVNGALGHLDMGHGYAVGADPFNPLPNATILLEFPVRNTERPIGDVVHFNKRWDIVAANHPTHANARAGVPIESQYACGSNASRVPDMADEIVCFSLDPDRAGDGSLDVLVVAQVMTDLDAPGGRDLDGDSYEKLPKGNLDVTGRYFVWTTNLGGDRLDAFLVKIPAERLDTDLGDVLSGGAPAGNRGGRGLRR